MNYITTAHQAELNAAARMRSWGFVDAKASAGGSDGGIDVRSRRAYAQVKWRGGVVGRPDLQRLVGARGNGGQQLIFFAASGYSRHVVTYADEMSVALFVYDPLGKVEAVNAAGRGLLKARNLNDSNTVSDVWFFVGVAVVAVMALVFALLL